MNRRKFLQIAGLTGSGLVASATMAEAGLFAEIASWLKRRPVWSIPKNAGISLDAVISPTVETIVNELGLRAAITLNTIAADDLLPELALGPLPDSLRHLSSIYYDRKALDNLKANLSFWEGTGVPRSSVSAWEEVAASDARALSATRKLVSATRKLEIDKEFAAGIGHGGRIADCSTVGPAPSFLKTKLYSI